MIIRNNTHTQSMCGNKVQFMWTCNCKKKNIEIKLDFTDCCCDCCYDFG